MKYIVRRPLLSFQNALDILELLKNINPEIWSTLIIGKFEGILLESIFINSPTLYEEVVNTQNIVTDKLAKSLLKYYLRMTCRATPFGLNAGVGLIDSDFKISNESMERHIRLDMGTLERIANELENDILIKETIQWKVNSALYSNGITLRLPKREIRDDSFVNYKLEEFDNNIAFEILKGFNNKSFYLYELRYKFIEMGAMPDQTQSIINSFIHNQIVISELTINVNGPEYEDRFIEILGKIELPDPFSTKFTKLVATLDQLRLNNKIETIPIINYKNLQKCVQEFIPVKIDVPFIQVDTYLTSNIELDKSVVNSMLEITKKLAKFWDNKQTASRSMGKFIKDFNARYESRWVKLAECLDEFDGIGYGDEEMIVPIPTITELNISLLLSEALQNRTNTVDIGKLLDNSKSNNDKITIPKHFSVLFSTIDDDCKYYLKYIGSGLTPLIGRFAFLKSNIRQLCEELAKKEQLDYQHFCLAEIGHIPKGRLGNISSRPLLSEYEIPYLTYPGIDNEKSLDINSLWVNVQNNKVFLWSKKLEKYILPRLSTAHNYSAPDNFKIYRFLCDLQYYYDKQAPNVWSWGNNQSNFYPRVIYQNFILSPALVIINKQFINYTHGAIDIKVIYSYLNEIVRKFDISNLFFLVQGDNELLIDINNTWCLENVLKVLNTSNRVELKEYIKPSGDFRDEILLPIVSNHKFDLPSPKIDFVNFDNIERTFYPTSFNWLYLKIYGGNLSINRLIIESLPLLVDDSVFKENCSKWFFIRYNDPKCHIRIRFLPTTADVHSKLFESINLWLNKVKIRHLIRDISYATYEREIERYGVETIELCESIFHYSSKFIVSFYRLSEDLNNDLNSFSLLSTYLIIKEILGTESVNFIKSNANPSILNMDKAYSRKDLNKDALKHFEIAIELLSVANPLTYSFSNLLLEFKLATIPLIAEVQAKTKDSIKFNNILRSIIHMHINRIYKENNNYWESLIYVSLDNYINKQKWNGVNQPTKAD